MQQRLLAMGAWLQMNGEAIYGTRPWKVYGEGIVPLTRSRDEHRRHTINSSGIRYTASKNGKAVYALLLERPETVTLKSFQGEQVTGIEVLGNGPAGWKRRGTHLVVSLPEKRPCDYAYVLKVNLR